MGLAKAMICTTFHATIFISYRNISKFPPKTFDRQKWEKVLFLDKPSSPLDSQLPYFLRDVQVLWSYDYGKWANFAQNRILPIFGDL